MSFMHFFVFGQSNFDFLDLSFLDSSYTFLYEDPFISTTKYFFENLRDGFVDLAETKVLPPHRRGSNKSCSFPTRSSTYYFDFLPL